MPLNVGDVIRVVARMSDTVDDILNVYHLLIAGSEAPSNEALLTAISTAMETAYTLIDHIMPDNIDSDTIEVYNVTADEFVGFGDWGTFTGGDSTSWQLPPQVSPLVRFLTDTLGSQGRKFLPPFVNFETIDNDGSLLPATITAMGNFGTVFLNDLNFPFGSAPFGNWNATLNRFSPWTAVVPNDQTATQRRRYRGKGS